MKNTRSKISKIYKHIPSKLFLKVFWNYLHNNIDICFWLLIFFSFLLLGQLQKEKQLGVGIRNQVYDSSLGDEDKLTNGDTSLVIQS